MKKLFTAILLIIAIIVTSCKDEDSRVKLVVDPAIQEIYNDYYSYSLNNPHLSKYFQNPDWGKAKSSKNGDTTLHYIPFSSDLVANQVLLVKSFHGRRQFDIQVQNNNFRLSEQDKGTRHIYFPVHPEKMNARTLAGGHNCGTCHNYAWWDTFDEVTIVGSAPSNDIYTFPGYWGGLSTTYIGVGGNVILPTVYADNKLTSPCLNNVFNQMRKGRFDNKVQNILSKFDKAANISFKIQNEWMTSTSINATTVGSTITLNLNALENASQEFIAKVIYHEVLHVYLGGSANSDHTTMANKYVTPMAEALMAWFPISQVDATALAWSGLKDRPAWNSVSASDKLAYLGVADRYKNLNNGYNHQFGHACP